METKQKKEIVQQEHAVSIGVFNFVARIHIVQCGGGCILCVEYINHSFHCHDNNSEQWSTNVNEIPNLSSLISSRD